MISVLVERRVYIYMYVGEVGDIDGGDDDSSNNSSSNSSSIHISNSGDCGEGCNDCLGIMVPRVIVIEVVAVLMVALWVLW